MKAKELLPLLILTLTTLQTAACIHVDSGPPDMQTMKESRPVAGAKEFAVRVNYDVGALEVRSMKGADLFSFNLDYDARRSSPAFDFNEGEQSRLTLSMNTRHMGFNHSKQGNDLNLRLNDAVPLDLEISTGVSDAHMDMTDLDIRRLRLRGGVGRTDVSFDHAAEVPMESLDVDSGVGNLTMRGLGNVRVARMRVNGGVGKTELDFTGDLKETRNDTEINVGVGHVRLTLPREGEVTIEGEGGLLSNISAPGFEKEGHTYTHRSAEAGAARIFIRVRSGVGGVSVELR
jgi:hypothetical protein